MRHARLSCLKLTSLVATQKRIKYTHIIDKPCTLTNDSFSLDMSGGDEKRIASRSLQGNIADMFMQVLSNFLMF
ncbi:hypothetical protein DPMN_010851 [Dreissena polymorpha]|uniref:Uncharacterized protein n=1 Tax=Dreissena polymorpha TaxID=45954 RepID=A0A9D4N2S8_DREPO|nr:hypothetical protein DPMN_010851 [Dreissena polymorpha]